MASVDGRADEPCRRSAPQAELDLLAVDQDQPQSRDSAPWATIRLQRDGLAAAGFAAEEHVALGQVDVDLLADLVDAQVHRAEDRQREHRHGCLGQDAGAV